MKIAIFIFATLLSAVAFAEGGSIAPSADRLAPAPQGFAYAPFCIRDSDGGCSIIIYGDAGISFGDGGSAISSPGWQTAFYCDFRQQTSVSLTGNGSATICGKTLTYINTPSSNASNGVFILPDAGGMLIDFSGAAGGVGSNQAGPLNPDAGAINNNPRALFALPDLLPNLDQATPIRLTIHLAAGIGASGAGGSAGCMVTMDTGVSNSYFTSLGVGLFTISDAENAGQLIHFNTAGTTFSVTRLTSGTDGYDSISIVIPNGIGLGMFLSYANVSGSGGSIQNANVNTWRALGAYDPTVPTNILYNQLANFTSTWMIGLQANGAIGHASPCVIRELKIEYRN